LEKTPPGGGEISADVIWGKNMKREREKEKGKEKGRRKKEKRGSKRVK
jgi:hypothetical protein